MFLPGGQPAYLPVRRLLLEIGAGICHWERCILMRHMSCFVIDLHRGYSYPVATKRQTRFGSVCRNAVLTHVKKKQVIIKTIKWFGEPAFPQGVEVLRRRQNIRVLLGALYYRYGTVRFVSIRSPFAMAVDFTGNANVIFQRTSLFWSSRTTSTTVEVDSFQKLLDDDGDRKLLCIMLHCFQ